MGHAKGVTFRKRLEQIKRRFEHGENVVADNCLNLPALYFIADAAGQYAKIGYSTNLPKRMAQLQVASPVRLEVIGVMPGAGKEMEKHLHMRFTSAPAGNEWFCIDDQLGQYLAENTMSLDDFESLKRRPDEARHTPTCPAARGFFRLFVARTKKVHADVRRRGDRLDARMVEEIETLTRRFKDGK